jgi:hypothetical protein
MTSELQETVFKHFISMKSVAHTKHITTELFIVGTYIPVPQKAFKRSNTQQINPEKGWQQL